MFLFSAGLARLPLVNSYARTPPLVWKLGWMPSPGGDMRTRLPPLPLEYLQEKDVLREFIFRVNALGMHIVFRPSATLCRIGLMESHLHCRCHGGPPPLAGYPPPQSFT